MEIGYQYYKWLDILSVTKDAAITFVKDFISFVRYYDDKSLPSITDQPCQCGACEWSGTVWDTESIDDDGNLGCPECLTVIEVTV